MENNKLNRPYLNRKGMEDVDGQNVYEEELADEMHEDDIQGQEQVSGEVEPNILDGLFADDEQAITQGGNQLSHTARLTQVSEDIARQVFEKALADDSEDSRFKIQASQDSHDAMDDLINEHYALGKVDMDYLKALDEEKIDRMIRSQQSKRSRAKSRTMTRDNYLTMMTGAVAENILRIAGNKPKSSGGGRAEIGYSDEDLRELANYPEDLTRAIRNVQSKKSIERSKAGFSEDSVRWKQLIETEDKLKAIRDQQRNRTSREAAEALERQQMLNEMLGDVEEIHPDQAAEMIASIRQMLGSE